MQQTTGTTELLCISAHGERIPVIVAIGHPFPTPGGEWACPVSMVGLQESVADIHGLDSFQAISLAVAFVRDRLTYFIASGGRIVHPTTGEGFPIDAYFPAKPNP